MQGQKHFPGKKEVKDFKDIYDKGTDCTLVRPVFWTRDWVHAFETGRKWTDTHYHNGLWCKQGHQHLGIWLSFQRGKRKISTKCYFNKTDFVLETHFIMNSQLSIMISTNPTWSSSVELNLITCAIYRLHPRNPKGLKSHCHNFSGKDCTIL